MSKSFPGASNSGMVSTNDDNRKGDFMANEKHYRMVQFTTAMTVGGLLRVVDNSAAINNVPLMDGLLDTQIKTTRQKDFELAQSCVHGTNEEKKQASEKLWLAAYPKVRGHSWKILTTEAKKAGVFRRVQKQDVEELTSEAFLRAFEGVDRFKGKSAFSTFVNGCAKNVVMEEQKKQRLDNRKDEEGKYRYANIIRMDGLTPAHREAIELEADVWHTDELSMARRDRNALVRKIWGELPPELAEALYWQFVVTDCSYKETALHMGLEHDYDVDNRIRKAKKLIEEGLMNDGFNPEQDWLNASW